MLIYLFLQMKGNEMKEDNSLKTFLIVLLVVGLGVLIYFSMRPEMPESEMPVSDQGMGDTVRMPEMSDDEEMEEMQNIVEIAISNPNFSTLVTAVQEAELVETLSGDGPFTVFAPTNEAFAKIPEETLNEILADKEQLTAILTYHVVAGKVMAEDVVNLDSATTVQGSDVEIDVMGNSIMINNAEVVQTDIEASNGVIHVIDTVLIPQ
jgi:uncharacterized surface protein with fasciclin (FAS1) repeats